MTPAPSQSAENAPYAHIEPASLADLAAFGLGHATDAAHATGCTVVAAPEGAVCGVAVRGGGPATRETDLLKPENMVEDVHAVVLSGGSAFGLEASCGVMEALAEAGCGFELCGAHVPIVVGACLFDLAVGEPAQGAVPAHPDKRFGYEAARAALRSRARSLENPIEDAALPFLVSAGEAHGNIGAGTGATVGKLLEPKRAMKSGLGMAFLNWGDLYAGAIVAVNALGHVRDEAGAWLAGCIGDDGRIMDALDAASRAFRAPASYGSAPVTNTTIGVVITNAKITKAQATKTASTAHDAYARTIEPVHTLNDGDTIFCFASREVEAAPDAVTILATKAMERAVRDAVRSASGACGLLAASDISQA